MKKIQRKSSSLSLETIKQIYTLAEELKLNLNEQNKIDSYFNIPENAELIKLILSKKNKSELEIFIIKTYLKTLHNFISVINESEEEKVNIDLLLNKISQDLKCENFEKNTLLMKIGEIGKTFYVILSGSVDILVPKEIEVYMSKSEYIDHLKILYLYKEDFLFEKTYDNNFQIYQIKKDEIEINEKLRINYNINMNLDNYLNLINANNLQKEDKTKVHLKIMGYFKVLSLGIGNSFGDYALINENSLRTATIFVRENSFFGTLTKHSYQNSIKSLHVRNSKLDMNFIFNTKLFEQMTFQTLTNVYWNFFIKKRKKKDEYLFHEQSQNDKIIFFFEGEVSLIIPQVNNKKINELISKIGNSNLIYDYENDNDKPNDVILKYVKKGDILGMNDIVIDNQFICNAICKSDNSIYFSIDIKIFKMILSRYDLVKKAWKKLENSNKNFVIERLKIIKETRNKGLIKNIREKNKKIEIDKICQPRKSVFDLVRERNNFYEIKKSFELESKQNKSIKKRVSQIYIQKMKLNKINDLNRGRNSILLPRISSILNLQKDEFIKNLNIDPSYNNGDKNNLSSSSLSSSSSISKKSSSNTNKTMKSNKTPVINNIKTTNVRNINIINSSDNYRKISSRFKVKTPSPNDKKLTFRNKTPFLNRNITIFNKPNFIFSDNIKKKISRKIKIKTDNNSENNKLKIDRMTSTSQLSKSKILSRNKKISLVSDFETTEFSKRIKFNDPISNILVSDQNKMLKKNYMESHLFKTMNNSKKSEKKIRFNSFNKTGIKYNKIKINNLKSNNIPSNFWNNSRNKGIKFFLSKVFG